MATPGICAASLSAAGGRATSTPATDVARPPTLEPLASIQYEEEPGFLDLVEIASDHMDELNANATRIADATRIVGGQIDVRRQALEELSAAGKSPDVKAWKRITNLVAADM